MASVTPPLNPSGKIYSIKLFKTVQFAHSYFEQSHQIQNKTYVPYRQSVNIDVHDPDGNLFVSRINPIVNFFRVLAIV